jgi:hypothetical protein
MLNLELAVVSSEASGRFGEESALLRYHQINMKEHAETLIMSNSPDSGPELK